MHSLPFSQPAFKVALLFCCGILIGESIPFGHPLVLPLAVASGTLTGLVFLRRGFRAASSCAAALVCLAAGAAKIGADRETSFGAGPWKDSRPLLCVGMIAGPPSLVDRRHRFLFRVDHCVESSRKRPIGALALVTVAPGRRDSLPQKLNYGDFVALRCVIEPLTDERNPGEFSPRKYYEANGISFLLFVRGSGNVVRLDSGGGWWLVRTLVAPAREYVLALIDSTVGGQEGEFLKGILLGERSGMSQSIRQAFVNSGVAHVLAVSGSNVVVVLAVVFLVLEILRIPRLYRVLLAGGALLFYMLLTGNQPPVVRATIMVLVFLASTLAQERADSYNALGISALVILGYDARQMFDVGFQLSFGAVLSIVSMYPRANAWISRIKSDSGWHRALLWTLRLCAVSLVATLGTLPLTAVHFGRVSLIGVLANLVVIPAVGLSVVLGMIQVALSPLSSWVSGVYAGLNKAVLFCTLEITRQSGHTPFAYLDTLRFRPVDAFPFYAMLFLLAHVGERVIVRRSVIAFLLALDFALFAPRGDAASSAAGRLRVAFLDVGQGDAAVVEFPDGSCMVVDSGPRQKEFDAGDRVVAPYLKRRGIGVIDRLCISHAHNDHLGGVPALLEQFAVRSVVEAPRVDPLPLELLVQRLSAARRVSIDSVGAGMIRRTPGNTRMYVLSPFRTGAGATAGGEGELNTSVVIRLQYGRVSFLFTGDAGGKDEAALLAGYGGFLQSTVLKAGHHGSRTGNTGEFLAAVHPAWTVISVGRHNRFGHPSPLVLERLGESKSGIARTDEEGAIIFETDGEALWRVVWR